jgi:membrane protease YdiL (CAAX protease family)
MKIQGYFGFYCTLLSLEWRSAAAFVPTPATKSNGGFAHPSYYNLPSSLPIDTYTTSSFGPSPLLEKRARRRIHQFPSKSFSLGLSNELQNDEPVELATSTTDAYFSVQNLVPLIGAQSLLILVSVGIAKALHISNSGLGPNFILDGSAFQMGCLATLPLIGLAFVLDKFEKDVPALLEVSRATQRSVLAMLGEKRKPMTALVASLGLGIAAGVGEEMLFRGIIQGELVTQVGDIVALISSAIVFGALHAVTPLYAILAGVASLYFGELYLSYDNLAVPIVCHAVYDVWALLSAHWAITGMTEEERAVIANWEPAETR